MGNPSIIYACHKAWIIAEMGEYLQQKYLTSCQEKCYGMFAMMQLTVGQFKSKFSEVLSKVLQGESVGITYGKNKKKVAAFVPYNKWVKQKKIKLGIWEGKGSFKLAKDFKMTEEEFLKS